MTLSDWAGAWSSAPLLLQDSRDNLPAGQNLNLTVNILNTHPQQNFVSNDKIWVSCAIKVGSYAIKVCETPFILLYLPIRHLVLLHTCRASFLLIWGGGRNCSQSEQHQVACAGQSATGSWC